MGMFDNLRCEYPLPIAGANAWSYQTKDTPNQYLDEYLIRADGTLWVEEYDVEDRSNPLAEGLSRLAGSMTRVNQRWVQVSDFDGELEFYTSHGPSAPGKGPLGWVTFCAVFRAGHLQGLTTVEFRRITEEDLRSAGLPVPQPPENTESSGQVSPPSRPQP